MDGLFLNSSRDCSLHS